MRWKNEQGKRERTIGTELERVQFALAEYENFALSDANGARRQKRAAGSGLVTPAAIQRIRLSRINRASVARKLNRDREQDDPSAPHADDPLANVNTGAARPNGIYFTVSSTSVSARECCSPIEMKFSRLD